MTRPNDNESLGSVVIGVLSSPGRAISRLAWRFLKLNHCEVKGYSIVLHSAPFATRTIQESEIETWSAHPEMGVDVVHIRLTSGEILTWFDKYNDLLDALRQLAKTKEASPN